LAKSKASIPAYISNKGNEKAAVNHREEQHNNTSKKNNFMAIPLTSWRPVLPPFLFIINKKQGQHSILP
jgi:hypothetical protein